MEALNPVLQEASLIGCEMLVTDKKNDMLSGFSFVKNPYAESSIVISNERELVIISQRGDGVFLVHDFIKILDYHRTYDTLIPQHTPLYEEVNRILEELGEAEEIFYSKIVP